jgi:hypothetical protein
MHLPVELHTSILKFLLSLSRQSASSRIREAALLFGFTPPLDPDPVIWEWIEGDLRSESLFPFNAASVCKLWRDILARMPECWTRVVFDVVSDPGPFLNAFSWSRNLEKIEVAIFNSSEYAEDVDEALEKNRISAIAQALQPHVHRCGSISFDIIYSSSLPSPNIFFLRGAPDLYELILECRIDDFDASTHPLPPTPEEQPTFATSFPQLGKLSIPAFWLIDMPLFTPDPDWLDQLNSSKIDITIANFEFPQNGQYSLTNFLTCLCRLKDPTSISLRNLTLSYEYCGHNLDSLDTSNLAHTICANIHFTSTSKDFITHLYSIANVISDETLSFEDCEIPNISHLQNAHYIYLVNIPDDQGLSLRNILAAWDGSRLEIHSCPSFNDTFLSWLRSEGEHTRLDSEGSEKFLKIFPAENLTSLHVEDCVDFTTPALVDVIRFRQDTRAAFLELEEVDTDRPLHTYPIDSLSVTGRGPMLTVEAMNWFQSYDNRGNISVTWHTEDDEGEGNGFLLQRLYD